MRAPRILSFAVLFLLVCISVGCGGRQAPTEEQAQEYKTKAEPITKALEAYYAKHGKYPGTIEEIGMEHFKTPYGSSHYEVLLNGQMCQLIIGDPETGKYFNLHWTGTGRDGHKSPQKWTWVVYPK
jgi:hypothetical protein